MLHCLLALALMSCSFGLSSTANANLRMSQERLSGSITGKITAHGKGKPGVKVYLRALERRPQSEPLLRTISDADGNYRLSGVSPGQWFVVPFAPGQVVANQSAGSPGKMVVVVAGDAVEGIDFYLVDGGAVTGKVTEANGRPLIEERINVIDADLSAGAMNANGDEIRVVTDDRGIYRVFGVPPGRYKIVVGQTGSGFVNNIRRKYPQTYYPGTADSAKASVLDVKEGSETAHIDIVVGRPLTTFSVLGQVVDDKNGKGLPHTSLGLARLNGNQEPAFYPALNQTDNVGAFRIEGLLPGRYAIFAQSNPDHPLYSDPIPFEVSDNDIEGLLVKTSSGAGLSGKVVIEGTEDKTFLAKLSLMRLNVYVSSVGNMLPHWHSAAINPDGSFHVGGIQPGTATINTVSSSDSTLVKDLLIIQTERYGIEQPRGFELKANEQLDGLTVLVSYGTGTIHGRVKYENGGLPAGSRTMVKVTRTEKITPLTATNLDARGQFQIDRLPPGSYWLDVDTYMPAGSNRVPSQRRQIDVAGGISEITITIDLNPQP